MERDSSTPANTKSIRTGWLLGNKVLGYPGALRGRPTRLPKMWFITEGIPAVRSGPGSNTITETPSATVVATKYPICPHLPPRCVCGGGGGGNDTPGNGQIHLGIQGMELLGKIFFPLNKAKGLRVLIQ